MTHTKERPNMAKKITDDSPKGGVETVPIDSLMHDPANVRKHGERNLLAIKSSLARWGQQHPLVVNKDGVVVAGNGRLSAMKSLGWQEVKIIRTDLSGAEAKAFAIADNRTAELASWDDDALAQTLAALQNDESIEHIAAGFTDYEINAIIGLTNEDAESEWEGMPGFEHEDQRSHRSIKVHFRNDESFDEFMRLVKQTGTDKTKYIWFPELEIKNHVGKEYK